MWVKEYQDTGKIKQNTDNNVDDNDGMKDQKVKRDGAKFAKSYENG